MAKYLNSLKSEVLKPVKVEAMLEHMMVCHYELGLPDLFESLGDHRHNILEV